MKFRLPILLLWAMCLGGCASLGITTPFGNDPLTGGVNAGSMQLLQIPIPPGMQYYPSHSNHVAGAQEGVETYRGHVDQAACAINLYNSLRAQGWQLRMYERYGKRGVFVYQKGERLAVCAFGRQGMLTILDVWVAPWQQDNAVLTFAPGHISEEPLNSMEPEEYPPVGKPQDKGKEEHWGLEEKDL